MFLVRGCFNATLAPMSPLQQAMTSPFLDLHLMMEARRMKKTVVSLESIEIYCEVRSIVFDSNARTTVYSFSLAKLKRNRFTC